MTRQCKKLLKAIQTFTIQTSIEWSYDHKQNIIWKIGVPNSRQDLSAFSGELDTLVDALLESGHISQSRFGFKLTHKGLHPAAVTWEDVKAFLLRSILVPVFVTVATTIVINVLEI